MEALEEPPITNALEEGVNGNTCDETIINTEASVEMDVCHTSNGVAESDDVELKNEQDIEPVVETTAPDVDALVTKFEEDYDTVNEAMDTEVAEVSSVETDNPVYSNEVIETEIATEIQEAESTEVENVDGNIVIESDLVEIDGIVDNNAGNITFETEIFIENNAAEFDEETNPCDEPDSSNILNEFGQNIELSEVLRSSDVSETVENNNCEQEVFNKEELLDILEGNDEEQSRKMISEKFHEDSKKLEEHLAMQQLNRLKSNDSRKKNRYSPKKTEKRQPKKSSSQYVPKEVRTKLEEMASLTNDPKETKGKEVEAASSKNTPKGLKGKEDVIVSSNNDSREMKLKVVEAASSNRTLKGSKGKLDEIASKDNDPKETKETVVEEASLNRTPKRSKGKVDEIVTSNHALKDTNEIVAETASSNNTPKETKERAVETVLSYDVLNKTRGKGDGKSSSLSIQKSAKTKIDDKPKRESIVTALVQDWSDDENLVPDESSTVLEASEALLESTEDLAKSQESVVQHDTIQNESQGDERTVSNADASVNDDLTPNNKSGDEAQPQRRLGRVIKKKVIYDPDNPDTFTKTKVHIKKEKDALPEKDQVPSTPKRVKTDQSPQTPKTKSPVSKMQWKKPQPRNCKQSSKRLTEIDKLLMDEGAVNMICQLTPEAPTGNKNMKSKAEFIKNIQSNTPGTKEMKFRERKTKKSDSDPKKLGSAKHRLSLSSSVKSPTVSEDFENHSADDSIIYRRHSSSSYSSSCMSPRRLSDVEGSASQTAHRESQDVSIVGNNHHPEAFMEKTSTPSRDIMNKSDCLSIKKKLNSKLSQALNKRKLTGFKSEKPSKVKKVVPVEEVSTDVTVNFNQNVAEICIQKAGSLFNIQIMKVLENILTLVDSNKNITVTLITSECGTICSGLDLKPILEDVKHAQEIADHARSLMHTLEMHSKLVIVGVEGKTQGFSLALAALCDVLLASEDASFALSERCNAVLNPGAGVLTSRALPQNLLNDLIVFGKELSASEALQGGLVGRVVWPKRFQEQVRAIAKDIAAQPFENIMLRKQLLGLKKSGASTFQTCLEKERDLLVNYWTSAEGMQLLRANLDAA